MAAEEEPTTWSLSGSPVSALLPGAILMVGYEPEEGGGRVYLGTRATGIHLHVRGETAQQCETAWAMGGSPHLWARDIPVEAMCGCIPEAELNKAGKEALG